MRLAVRRDSRKASRMAATEAIAKPQIPPVTRLLIEDRGMEARPIMPSAKRLDT